MTTMRTTNGWQPTSGPRTVAFYSHDTQGLGHIRRNIALASSLVGADDRTDALLLTGAPEATTLPLPPRTEVLTLPTLRKDRSGGYAPRVLSRTLDEVLALRSEILAAALTRFPPDLLVVDKVARGLGDELDEVLQALRRSGTTKVVLGLREVLDDPVTTKREWDGARTSEVVDALYDEVWVYGDQEVFDPVVEYGLPPEVARKVRFTGYLGTGRSDGVSTRVRPGEHSQPPRGPYVLCTVGGGQDGLELADSFVNAPMPAGHCGLVLTGPYMRREVRDSLLRATRRRPDVEILDFVPDAEAFLAQASAVVSMAGYNSVCELLAARRRTLLVPRVEPRLEQLIRAEQLAARGLVDVLHPDIATPERVGRWLATAVTAGPVTGRPVDLDGLARVPDLAEDLLARPSLRPPPVALPLPAPEPVPLAVPVPAAVPLRTHPHARTSTPAEVHDVAV